MHKKNNENNKQEALESVKSDSFSLRDMSNELQNDKEIVIMVVTKKGNSLRFSSAQLKIDIDIIMASVTQCGFLIQYASKQLINDKFIALSSLNITDLKDIFVLIGEGINNLPYAINTIEDAKFILKAIIEQEELNESIIHTTNNIRLNKT